MNKEPRLRFTDEERSDPVLEKPIRKAEKAAARADKAQANIPKKKVRQTVIDPDTGKKTSKLTFEDKKKPPSKVSQGVREAPVHLVAGKLAAGRKDLVVAALARRGFAYPVIKEAIKRAEGDD